MKRLLFASLSVLSLCAVSAFAEEWTGYISDSKCAKASDTHADCAVKCVKGGASPVFVAEDGKVYKIDDPAKVMEHVGHKVTVTGTMDGDTVKVESVKM